MALSNAQRQARHRAKKFGEPLPPIPKSPSVKKAVDALTDARPATRRFRTALEFAMDAINDPECPVEARVRLAIAAMPFQHAKLAEKPAGKKDDAEEAAKRASEGRFAAPAAPKLVVSNK